MIVDVQAQQLRKKIEGHIGAEIADVRFFANGQNANIYIVDLDDNRRMIAKSVRHDPANPPGQNLEVEGWMLSYLEKKTKLPVPRAYWYDSSTILMDFIEDSGPINDNVQSHAAEVLAALHSINADFFGLERDTVITTLKQPNHFEMNWVTFFRDYRLLYMAREAMKEGAITAGLMSRIEKLAGKIGDYIGSTVKPSLVHGDLWGGNIMLGAGQVNGFLDPAIYYADPEIELSFIHLFGTFGEAFFNRYNDIHPIDAGFWQARRDIYALYPMLVQVRRGEQAPLVKIESIVDRFVG